MAIVIRKTHRGASYVVRVRDQFGRWFPSKSFKRRIDAERHERELETKRDKGGLTVTAEQRLLTAPQYLTKWSEDRAHKISKGWSISQKRMIKSYVLPVLGKLKLVEVQPQHIGEILAAASLAGLGAQSLLHIYNLLHHAFGDAVDYYGFLAASPVMKRDRPRVPRVERKFLTPEQSWRLLRAAESHYLAPAIWISVLAGLRCGEVQALRWSSVNFEKGHIQIRESYKRAIGVIEPFPKQKDWGLAPMPAALMAYLKQCCVDKADDDFVAPARRGGMLEQKKFHDGLKSLCKVAGVHQVSPHELRHSCTEIWFASGASLEDVRRVLNHKSSDSTQRYVHRTNDRLLALAQQIVMPIPTLTLVT